MKLGVYSMQKVFFNGDASSITCNTRSGEITILDNHEPIISMLEHGTIKVIDEQNKEHYIPAKGGFLEVNSRNQAKILIDEENA